MNVVRCTEEHVTDAIAWQAKWRPSDPPPPRDLFSSTGWCVPGLAAWWLYLTDSSLAWTEMLVVNPDAGKVARRDAMDLVIERVLAEARDAGTRLLVCNIDRPDLEERAIKHGYRVLARGQTLIGINLNGGA